MLKEIPEKKSFEGKIPTLRITVTELISVLKSLDDCKITAVSKNAKFEELADIEKNPGRFSGNPRVEVSSLQSELNSPTIDIDFRNDKTTVTPRYRYLDSDDASNLARRVHGELLPFSNQLEYYFRWFATIVTYLSVIGGLAYLFLWLFNTVKEAPQEDILPERLGQILLWSFCGSYWTGVLLDRRKPVKYNPRETWWQKHSGTLIFTISGSTISSLVVYYLTKN
jgi:hypothetical protein